MSFRPFQTFRRQTFRPGVLRSERQIAAANIVFSIFKADRAEEEIEEELSRKRRRKGLRKYLPFLPEVQAGESRYLSILLLEVFASGFSRAVFFKVLQKACGYDDAVFLLLIGMSLPFLKAFSHVFSILTCPKLTAIASNAMLVVALVFITAFAAVQGSSPVDRFVFTLLIWPWFVVLDAIARLYIGRDKKALPFKIFHLPLFAIIGVTAEILSLFALPALTVTQYVALHCLELPLGAILTRIVFRRTNQSRHTLLLVGITVMVVMCLASDELVKEMISRGKGPQLSAQVEQVATTTGPPGAPIYVYPDEERPKAATASLSHEWQRGQAAFLSVSFMQACILVVVSRVLLLVRNYYVKHRLMKVNKAIKLPPPPLPDRLFHPYAKQEAWAKKEGEDGSDDDEQGDDIVDEKETYERTGERLPDVRSSLPPKYRFSGFPEPMQRSIEILFSTCFYESALHTLGRKGTRDLHFLSDFLYGLPLVAFWTRQDRVRGERGAEGLLDQLGPSSVGRGVLIGLLVGLFSLSLTALPWANAAVLFDRASPPSSWPVRVVFVMAPCVLVDTLYIHPQPSSLGLALVAVLLMLVVSYRQKVYEEYHRQELLQLTNEAIRLSPATMRTPQKRVLGQIWDNTSTADYEWHLINTLIHKGQNIRNLVEAVRKQMGASGGASAIIDPSPAATAAWRLAASLVMRAVRKQKREREKEVRIQFEVYSDIQQMVHKLVDRAVDEAEFRGPQMQIALHFCLMNDQRRGIRRLRAYVQARKHRRSLAQLYTPNVNSQATKGGIFRHIAERVTKQQQLRPPPLPLPPTTPSTQHFLRNILSAWGGGGGGGDAYVHDRSPMALSQIEEGTPSVSSPPSRGVTGLLARQFATYEGVRSRRGSVALGAGVPPPPAPVRGWGTMEAAAKQMAAKQAEERLDDVVFAFGESSRGQLGVTQRMVDASVVVSVTDLRRHSLLGVAAGGCTSFAVTTDGRVYAFGTNRGLQLGLRRDQRGSSEPMRIKLLRDYTIVQIACGPSPVNSHTLALTAEGLLLSFGTSPKGALGLGADVVEALPTAVPLSRGVPIRQIAAGARHSVLCTDQGFVYTMGDGKNGQLGLGDFDNRWIPTRIEVLTGEGETACLVAAGDDHTLIACTSGNIYSFGLGSSGQLGLGKVLSQSTPQRIDKIRGTPVSMAGGSHHSLVVIRPTSPSPQPPSPASPFGLAPEGDSPLPPSPPGVSKAPTRTYGFGANSQGQLGLGRSSESRLVPVLLPFAVTESMTQVVAASAHSLFLNEMGQIFACGANEWGQLGFLRPGSPLLPKLYATASKDKPVGALGMPLGVGDASRVQGRASGHGERAIYEPLVVSSLSFIHAKFLATADSHTLCLGM
ncbi:unnamed protein product [Vitrella brassicaformis CCMP3155]|uniref:RCC1-like domain-containing protein n=1 Tax=Vitrella brassicaformis (strain CCMP3155) TaxID=1169540 RepID=A0A0G4H3V7_VITBC|nr:unnamed protein product [Vitrella brassicaformis CCMP3155]|eukprot:CEM38389.1 unnamed protein product [Vitrella brassicaformis CCMP3155]